MVIGYARDCRTDSSAGCLRTVTGRLAHRFIVSMVSHFEHFYYWLPILMIDQLHDNTPNERYASGAMQVYMCDR